MRKIKLTQGQWALVDDEDYTRALRRKWFARKSSNSWYAVCTEYAPVSFKGPKKVTVGLHRYIMQPGLGYEVDHIDGNGLNNQKSNLRICTRAENIRNTKPYGVSGIKGAYFDSRYSLPWRASLQYKGKMYYLGRFKTKEEAGAAYDRKARELYGQFARTNGLG